MKKGRPKKKFGKLDEPLSVWCSAKQKNSYEEAAEKSEMGYSEWVRKVLDEAAAKVLEKE